MSWRVLTLTNPGRVCVKHRQLNWTDEAGNIQNIPIEDISVLIIENPYIQISSAVLADLAVAGAVVFTCDSSHLPNGALFPFHNNSRYTESAFAQIESSLPFRKRMWQEIVVQKIKNQSAILRLVGSGAYKNLDILANSVQSGDCQNIEGVAARVYWGALWEKFNRNDISNVKNHALDYAYAVLRGCVARCVVGAGLLPFYGIHHCNKLDNFCLVDDLIEPWRPFADFVVNKIDWTINDSLTPQIKQHLISVLLYGCNFNGKQHSVLNAMPLYAESVASCFKNKTLTNLKLPTIKSEPQIINTQN